MREKTLENIDSLRLKGSLINGGLELENDSLVKLFIPGEKNNLCNDDLIIALGVDLSKKFGNLFTLIYKDFAMKIKASLQNANTDDYQTEIFSKENFYQGWKEFIYPYRRYQTCY